MREFVTAALCVLGVIAVGMLCIWVLTEVVGPRIGPFVP